MTTLSNRFLDLELLSPEVRIKVEEALLGQEKTEKNYMENYKDLKSSSSELLNMTEPDVDMVVPLVEKGLNGYKGCQARIIQVEAYVRELNGFITESEA